MMRDHATPARNPAVPAGAIAGVTCALLLACTGQESDAPPAAAMTRPVRVFNAPVAGIEPRLLMGVLTAGDTSRLGPVGHAAFALDGGFVVADTAALLVRGFSRLGQATFTVGSEGVGPGQFGRIASLTVSGDTVLIFDDRLWRITAFDHDGVLISTRRVEARPTVVPATVARRGADGHWLHVTEQVGTTVAAEAAGSAVVRTTATLARWSAPGGAWTTIAQFPGTEVYLAGDSAESPIYRSAPFARSPLWAPDGQGGYWYADSDAYSLMRVRANGDTVTHVTYGTTGPRVTEADRRDWVVDGGRLEASSPEARTRGALPVPGRRPVLLGLLASTDGEPWVAIDTGARDTIEWHALDQFGGPRRRVPLPRRISILAVRGDSLLVAGRDANGVAFAGRFLLGAGIGSGSDRRAGPRVTMDPAAARVAPAAGHDPPSPPAAPESGMPADGAGAVAARARRTTGGS